MIPNGGLPSRSSGNSFWDVPGLRLGPLFYRSARRANSTTHRKPTTTLSRTMPTLSSNIQRHPIRQLRRHLRTLSQRSTPLSPLSPLAPHLRTTAPCSLRPRHLPLLHPTRSTKQSPGASLSHTYAPPHHLITTGPSYLHWTRYKNTQCPSHSCLLCRSTEDVFWTYDPWLPVFLNGTIPIMWTR